MLSFFKWQVKCDGRWVYEDPLTAVKDLHVYFVVLFLIFFNFDCMNPQFGQTVLRMVICLSVVKEEITMLFPGRRVISDQIDYAQNGLTGFIPKMEVSSHICV